MRLPDGRWGLDRNCFELVGRGIGDIDGQRVGRGCMSCRGVDRDGFELVGRRIEDIVGRGVGYGFRDVVGRWMLDRSRSEMIGCVFGDIGRQRVVRGCMSCNGVSA